MDRQRVGLILFWIGFIWALLWGTLGAINATSYFRFLSWEEINKTIWAVDPPGLMMLGYGFFMFMGSLVAGFGLLLRAGAKVSTIWKYGIGMVVAVIIVSSTQSLKHNPRYFGIGGTLILLFCFGTLWMWADERMNMKKGSTIAGDLKL
ncbi:hypothetical protein SAMN02745945_00361 [Peptoclostridium litorale DSM 5388]|uniref:Uncharacterized protein n=1 Tax=Peptoclostridium litorale DSM 5388 TaxID=1121324 RepID=A0A069REP5_PEPLI|nr:hypothetical protein [Peptoclostridium litorale]KDR95268.1 hypothetical protein CLIT_11c02970 [Peptoclostridium litorale DSM 5388]SIN72476.1 hypothetical protein SAMN02745945_00361 [Peptoclostridium litorale DSM 5388]